METKISDRTMTVKEIFVNLLGEDKAEKILKIVEDNYNTGKRGEELKGIIEAELMKIPDFRDIELRLTVIPLQVIIPPVLK